jgi:hypothetical protein
MGTPRAAQNQWSPRLITCRARHLTIPRRSFSLEDLGSDAYWGIDHPVLFGADCWTMPAAVVASAIVTAPIMMTTNP